MSLGHHPRLREFTLHLFSQGHGNDRRASSQQILLFLSPKSPDHNSRDHGPVPGNQRFAHVPLEQSFLFHSTAPRRVNRFALCFQFDKAPAFLTGTEDVIDRLTGYLLIVEHREYIAIFKSQIDVSADFAKRHVRRISAQDVDRGLTSKDSVFARVRLRLVIYCRK